MLVRTSRRRHATRLHPRAARGLGCQVDVKEPRPSRLARADAIGMKAAPDEKGVEGSTGGRNSTICDVFLESPQKKARRDRQQRREEFTRSRALVPNHLREDTRDTRCSAHYSMQAGDRHRQS
jgi:hypothetical protein